MVLMPLLFFFNDTATTEIYTLSLHDALPISAAQRAGGRGRRLGAVHHRRLGRDRPGRHHGRREHQGDRKSTRLNSSHGYISYAVFCLKQKVILTMPLLLTRLTLIPIISLSIS